MKKEGKEYGFAILIQKKDPKPNAPEYRFETVEQIFDNLTEENVDRFLKDFSVGMKAMVLMREAAYEIARAEKVPEEDVGLRMEAFEWIDD